MLDPTLRRLARCLDTKRAHHPELNRRLTWNGIVAILRRERIPLVRVPMKRIAACVSSQGVTVILVSTAVAPRVDMYAIAHELAHAWLHVDTEQEPVWHMDADWPDDPREDEADTLASWMLDGADISEWLL